MNKNVSFTFQRLYPSGLREQIFMPGHNLQLTYIKLYALDIFEQHFHFRTAKQKLN